jgi:hypothetical protein
MLLLKVPFLKALFLLCLMLLVLEARQCLLVE